MPRFTRRPISLPVSKPPIPSPSGKITTGDKITDFVLSVVRTQIDPAAIDMIKSEVVRVTRDQSAANVVNLVASIVEIQVGEDEHASPMLVSLVDDLGVDPAEVELAQDIILAGLDVAKAIAAAVKRGDPKSVLWNLMGLVGQLIPELEADIAAIKK